MYQYIHNYAFFRLHEKMFVRVLTYLMASFTYIQAFNTQCSNETLINIMKEEHMCSTKAQTLLKQITYFDRDGFCKYLQNVAKCEKGYIKCYSIADVQIFKATIVELNIGRYLCRTNSDHIFDKMEALFINSYKSLQNFVLKVGKLA